MCPANVSLPCKQIVFGHRSVGLVAEVGERLLDHVGPLGPVLLLRGGGLVPGDPVLVDDVERPVGDGWYTTLFFVICSTGK